MDDLKRRARLFEAFLFTGLLLVVVALSSCARTKAYQRETLAKPVMALDGDGAREGLRNHVLSTREGAVGGFGGGGGGCGCN